LQEHDDLVVSVVRTRDLFPSDELGDLLGQLPEFLKIDVAVGQSVENQHFNALNFSKLR
jgi:hypothetical protein